MNNTAAKLAEYVEGAKQPAIQLFHTVRIFDPKQLPLLSHTFSDYVPAIAGLSAAAGEWQAYMDVAFWQSLAQQNRLTTLAGLARAYLALPVASVDVERSFSKYGSVLSPLRCSLAPDSIKAYCSVFYNNSLM